MPTKENIYAHWATLFAPERYRKLPELLEQLEQNLTRNGVTVHWAETVDEANGIVLLDHPRSRGAASDQGQIDGQRRNGDEPCPRGSRH